MTGTPAPEGVTLIGRIAFVELLGNLPLWSLIQRESGERWSTDEDLDENPLFNRFPPRPGVEAPDDNITSLPQVGHGDFFIRRGDDTEERRYRVWNAGD